MNDNKKAEQAAKKTAKKAAAKKQAVPAPIVQLKCRVINKIEVGQAVIAGGHPDPVLIEKETALAMQSAGDVKIIG